MKLAVVGRVVHKNKLIGAKFVDLDTLNFSFEPIEKFPAIFYQHDVINCTYDNSGLHSKWKLVHLKALPLYNKNCTLIKQGYYSESKIISFSLHIDANNIAYQICGALVSGAITDPDSIRAKEHAVMYYNEIRAMTRDIEAIAKRTNKSVSEIREVKNYLFMQQHNLDGEIKKFDPDFCIAQSWQRLLTEGMKIEEHDLILIEHELMEMNLVKNGMSQDKAHIKTSEVYDYSESSNKYYERLRAKR